MIVPSRNQLPVTMAAVLAALLTAAPVLAAPLRYNRDIRPLLSDNCFHCHGPDKNHRKGGMRLDIPGEALKPAKSGAVAIVPGKPEASELIARINHTDPDELMPPAEAHKILTAKQKEMLRQWIAEGAVYEAHWAYTPVVRPPVPQIVNRKSQPSETRQPGAKEGQIVNPIDAFIQQPLLEKGIAPSPLADPATLLRRLSLDLTGLPPSPGLITSADPSTINSHLSTLLKSPHYGERMAQHWLDVVRYADTVGFHGDQNHNAWAYRDWVIDAFNANKRFDEFTTEQLAGDLLPNPTESQWIATCFNRLTMMTREGGAQPGEYLTKYTADRVRTVSMAWMGATLGCAECHDHKFDPWRQKDFYSLGAFFADVKQWGVYHDYPYTPNPDLKGWSNDHPFPPERVVESPALKRRIAELEKQVESLLSEAAGKVPADAARHAAFRTWAAGTAAFLAAHPDGWETPVPGVEETTPEPAPRKAKRKAAPATAVEATAVPVAFEKAEVKDAGRILFASGGARTAEITLPVSGVVCAIRLELFPDKKHNNSVARTGRSVTLKPVFQRAGKGDKKEMPGVRWADATLKLARYANGLEVLGIQDGWTSQDGSAHVPHSSVWLLEQPAAFAPGESLRIVLPDNLASAVRISISPVINTTTADPATLTRLTAHLARADDVAMRWFIRSTPGDPVLKAVHEIDRQIIACRGGRTPVMVTERMEKPLTIRVLARGNWQDESGEVCKPSTPGFLKALPDAAQRDLTRLDLARWITSRENPLTARVIMNRLWRQFFGTGLSAQVDDLGAQGEAPSHPELLDWLAAEFMESGWDYRHMVQLIVQSHTYRQQSQPRAETREADPQNRWLASQNSRRLEAEAVRDNALAISGLINLTAGGPPVKPYQPANYYEGLQFPDRTWAADTGPDQWRRGIYNHWQRTFLHPMMANFDAPSREDCIAMRTAANTPQQALTLLNDPSFVEAARVWAAEVMTAAKDDGARIDTAFRKALARPPSSTERDGLVAFLFQMRAAFRERPDDATKLLSTGFAAKADAGTDSVELAAWASVCRVILNLHETITRY